MTLGTGTPAGRSGRRTALVEEERPGGRYRLYLVDMLGGSVVGFRWADIPPWWSAARRESFYSDLMAAGRRRRRIEIDRKRHGRGRVTAPGRGEYQERYVQMQAYKPGPPCASDLLDLRKSGLTDETIALDLYGTETNRVLIARMLDMKKYRTRCDALAIPYRDRTGKVRPDFIQFKFHEPRLNANGKPIKYESPRRSEAHAYFPARVIGRLDNLAEPLLITEGPKKTSCLAQHGYLAVGISGVWMGMKPRPRGKDGKAYGEPELIDDLGGLPLEGRLVFIVFDSDAATKAEVRAAERRFARTLHRYGAKVRIVRIPPRPNGEKMGADDYIVRYGRDAFQKLVDAAETFDPRPAKERKADAERERQEASEDDLNQAIYESVEANPAVPMNRCACHFHLFVRHKEKVQRRMAMRVLCGSWVCPMCQHIKRGVYMLHLGKAIRSASDVYLADVPEGGWHRFETAMRRCAKGDGTKLDYCRVLTETGYLVCCTVPVKGSRKVTTCEAAAVVRDAVAAVVARESGEHPIATSPGWRLIREPSDWIKVATLPRDLDLDKAAQVVADHGMKPRGASEPPPRPDGIPKNPFFVQGIVFDLNDECSEEQLLWEFEDKCRTDRPTPRPPAPPDTGGDSWRVSNSLFSENVIVA
jgi:hypothetical protein